MLVVHKNLHISEAKAFEIYQTGFYIVMKASIKSWNLNMYVFN